MSPKGNTLTLTDLPRRVLCARLAAGEQYLASNPTDVEAHREVAVMRDALAQKEGAR